MAGPESGFHFEHFQVNPEYPPGEYPPFQIADRTTFALNAYFYSGINDFRPTRDYLRDVTIPFIDRATIGVIENSQSLIANGLISEDDQTYLEERANRIKMPADQLANEAFGFSIAVLGSLPDIAKDTFQRDFSRRGLVSPPSTVREFVGRLDEIHDQVDKIIKGRTTPRALRSGNPSLSRMYAFFWTGALMPTYAEKNSKLVEARSKILVNKLVADVPINL